MVWSCVCSSTFSGVLKGEASLWLCQLVEVVQPYDIRCLKVALWVLVPLSAPTHLVIELGGGEGGQEGGVGTGDAHAIL